MVSSFPWSRELGKWTNSKIFYREEIKFRKQCVCVCKCIQFIISVFSNNKLINCTNVSGGLSERCWIDEDSFLIRLFQSWLKRQFKGFWLIKWIIYRKSTFYLNFIRENISASEISQITSHYMHSLVPRKEAVWSQSRSTVLQGRCKSFTRKVYLENRISIYV